jgi:glycosyltransferase involved in cell wall biosynthesis
MPKNSLLCAAYNAEPYIRETIESVLRQSFTDFEFLIYDDGSSDETLQVIRSFDDSRIRVFCDGKNRGQNARLHQMMEAARGEYIGWVDADDLLDERTLELTNLVLDQYTDYGMVYTDHYEMTKQGKITGISRRSQMPFSKDNLLLHFMTFNFRLFRKSCYKKIEPLDVNLRVASDYELSLKLAEVTHIKHLPLPLYYYRVYPESLSHRSYKEQSEVTLQLLRDAIKRRGMKVKVEMFYYKGFAKYRFTRLRAASQKIDIRNT